MKGNSDKALVSLMFAMGRRMKQEMYREAGMPSMLHFETLRYIDEEGKPTMSDVAGYLRVSAPSATTLIDTLIDDGIVTRAEDPNDRRRVRLALSAKGKKFLASASKARERAFGRIVARLSTSDRAELARILSIITSA